MNLNRSSSFINDNEMELQTYIANRNYPSGICCDEIADELYELISSGSIYCITNSIPKKQFMLFDHAYYYHVVYVYNDKVYDPMHSILNMPLMTYKNNFIYAGLKIEQISPHMSSRYFENLGGY